MNETKQWYQSKTVWVNVISILIAQLTLATDLVPKDAQPTILAIMGFLNIGLRLLTGKPITFSKDGNIKTLAVWLAVTAAFLAPCAGRSQSIGYQIHVDARDGTITQAFSTPITRLNKTFAGDLTLSAVVAAQSSTSLGVSITKDWKVAENGWLTLGLALRTSQPNGENAINLRGGVVIGITIAVK